VDDFHFRHVPTLPKESLVLDLGGNRIAKRGYFDIERYGLHVVYANLSGAKKPHVQAEAAFLPFKRGAFDAVICSELLEHVPDPRPVLREVCRVLRPGGVVLVCVPFLTRIHGDPYDYGRYTDYYWSENLKALGFRNVEIERQGGYWSVMMDTIRDLTYLRTSNGWLSSPWVLRGIGFAFGLARRKAVQWDRTAGSRPHGAPTGYTTGFGIRANKA